MNTDDRHIEEWLEFMRENTPAGSPYDDGCDFTEEELESWRITSVQLDPCLGKYS